MACAHRGARFALALASAALAGAYVHSHSVRMRCYGAPAGFDGGSPTASPATTRVFSHAACKRLAFTVVAPEDGMYDAVMVAQADTGSFDALTDYPAVVSINAAWHSVSHTPALTLRLRRGVNTVEVMAQLDDTFRLDVPRAVPRLPAGANLPYVEVQAENASFTGSVIGPSFHFTSIPAEAVNRMAVALAPGDTIDFSVPSGASANAIAFRFNIPDAANGGGIDTPALISVDGALVANVTLTSYFEYAYGGYPFTKNPSDGNPHHYFDTYMTMLPSRISAGSLVRITNPSAPGRLQRGVDRALQTGNCSNIVPGPERKDCGFNGINETTCLGRGCCWDPITPNPNNYAWCYYPQLPPPPPPEPGNVTIIIDLMDFYDVGQPDAQPPNSVSIVDFGADPTGANDSSQAITAAITAAVPAGKIVWVPAGNFTVTQHIALINNVSIVGAGPWYSYFKGNGVGLYGNTPASVNVHVQGLSIIGHTNVRIDSMADTGIGGSLTDSVVTNVHVTHTKCGMWLDGPFDNLLVNGLHVHDTFADGVNFHRGITNSVVEQSILRNTGDDCLAMWSDAQPDVNNTFQYNTMQVPVLANNAAIYGGSGNAIRNNYATDTLTQGGGLHVGNRFSSVALAGVTVLDGNEVHRGGQLDPNWNFGVGAIWFYALDSAMTGAITVSNNLVVDSPYEAVHFIGSTVNNVTLTNLTVVNVGTFVFQFQCGGSGSATNVVASGTQYYGQYNCGVPFTLTQGPGNAGWNTTTCGFPPMPAN